MGFTKREREKEWDLQREKEIKRGIYKERKIIILLKRKKIRLFCVAGGHRSSVILNIIKKAELGKAPTTLLGVIYALITMIREITSLKYMTNDDSKKAICIKRFYGFIGISI
ncbi:MAG: hypothetical protein PHW06_04410 [Candidatus Cloacimonas acidaminovorans]|nr:hypothetical protein [Candidatus Cloacimonas acidaminovorans]MDD5408013.1 hypothetical protein [Candidatus Cloacimonas acidaminovorans]